MNARATRIGILSIAIPLLGLGCRMRTATNDESQEPPLEFVVHVDDTSVTLIEGESGQVNGTFTNPKVSVTPRPYRTFPYQGITFQYPRAFNFEADLSDPDSKNWTLSGNDLKIMYFVLNSQLTTRDFAKDMIDRFGRENCKLLNANAKITLGKETLSGTTIQMTVASSRMVMDIYHVPSSNKSVTKILVFQDNLDDNGHRSAEAKQALKEIESSFTLEH